MTVARRLGVGEYYHIFNRGIGKKLLYKDQSDWRRFLFGILHFQSPQEFTNISRIVAQYDPIEGYPLPGGGIEIIQNKRTVELVCFALMPNHFHLLVREQQEGGISAYLQRIGIAYTKYFNTKYKESGYIFQGRYRTVHIKDNRQLLYLSAYIHRNPRELKGWRGKEFEYPWSSLQDYTTANRWGGLLSTDIIAGQFGATKNSNYGDFVRTSTAKSLEDELEASVKNIIS